MKRAVGRRRIVGGTWAMVDWEGGSRIVGGAIVFPFALVDKFELEVVCLVKMEVYKRIAMVGRSAINVATVAS